MTTDTQRKTFEEYMDLASQSFTRPTYQYKEAMRLQAEDYKKTQHAGYVDYLRYALQALPTLDGMVMEFGVDKQAGGFLSGLRVRWMMTAGGMQYGIHNLTNLGGQSAGYYTTNLEEALQEIIEREAHYTRPTRWSTAFQDKPGLKWKDNAWFFFKEGEQRYIPLNGADEEIAHMRLGDDTSTIELTL